ncbi:hypothetical protein Pmar_PMAR007319 [Perkinsus marinus ATCC 50983]|uniref:Uncharacterized protein n=1 Tax=Perkinsus marinus (strain ATCC 50983 / TXsc) TaxID=423536 RepID=C5K628_PERM5|nr:hypothetical protein Pmar_PMAR007319 [Perkinsus marinus ATCC 50983]EER20058.1 hypothetical protein Pmar_PMAR007319 [Perkinsus marinus ATCC 50983]|eukprot:XP_002788262.1 hypothetical protein Pmar_PMAR007319 [Perkinsus marinus ATCC 50983]
MPPIQKPLLPSGRAVLKHGRSMLCSGNLSYDVNSTIKAPECKRGMGFTQFKRFTPVPIESGVSVGNRGKAFVMALFTCRCRLATRLGKTRLRELPTTMM